MTEQKPSKKAEALGAEPKKKTAGPMYAIKSFNAAVARVHNAGMINNEQLAQLIEIKKYLMKNWLGEDMFN